MMICNEVVPVIKVLVLNTERKKNARKDDSSQIRIEIL